MALIELVEMLTASIDSNKVTVSVFIDLKKAFDAIDHSVLLQKLEYYGITGFQIRVGHRSLTEFCNKTPNLNRILGHIVRVVSVGDNRRSSRLFIYKI